MYIWYMLHKLLCKSKQIRPLISKKHCIQIIVIITEYLFVCLHYIILMKLIVTWVVQFYNSGSLRRSKDTHRWDSHGIVNLTTIRVWHYIGLVVSLIFDLTVKWTFWVLEPGDSPNIIHPPKIHLTSSTVWTSERKRCFCYSLICMNSNNAIEIL